jgi:hypothetical protein
MNDPLRLAAPDPYGEATHRHDKLQRLHPRDSDSHCILSGQIMQLGCVFAPDCLTPLLLARSSRIAFGQQGEARRVAMRVVMVRIEPLLIAVEAPVQTFNKA